MLCCSSMLDWWQVKCSVDAGCLSESSDGFANAGLVCLLIWRFPVHSDHCSRGISTVSILLNRQVYISTGWGDRHYGNGLVSCAGGCTLLCWCALWDVYVSMMYAGAADMSVADQHYRHKLTACGCYSIYSLHHAKFMSPTWQARQAFRNWQVCQNQLMITQFIDLIFRPFLNCLLEII